MLVMNSRILNLEMVVVLLTHALFPSPWTRHRDLA